MKYIIKLIITLLLFPIFLNAQENDDRVESLYSTACDAVLGRNLEYALKCLDEGMPFASEAMQRKYNWLYGHIYDRYASDMLYEDYTKAYPLYEKAYSFYSSARDYRNCVGVLRNMGLIMSNMDQFAAAIELWDFALYIADRYKFPAVDVIVEQKKLYEELKQYDKSASVALKLYSSYQNASTIEDKIKVLMQLAKEARVDKNYDLSSAYYVEIDNLSSQLSEDAQLLYKVLLYTDKHSLLQSMGQYDAAIEYAIAQISINEKLTGREDNLISIYLDLAYDYAALKQEDNALLYLGKATDKMSSVHVEKELLASRYSNIALTYNMLGKGKDALIYYDKAEELGYSKAALSALRGGTFFSMGKKKESREEYEKYSEIIRLAYGESSLQYAMSLQYLASINAFCRDMEDASRFYIDAAEVTRNKVYESMRYLSRTHRDSFWDQCASLFSQMAGFGLKAGFEQDEFTEAAYNALLLSKGLLLASDRSMASVVNESHDEDLIGIYNNCQKLYTDIEILKASGGTADQLRDMNDSLHKLELELQTRISQNTEYLSFLDIDYKDIQSNMFENEIVIDFTDFPGVKNPDRRFYAAFVYRKGWQHPKMIRMFEEKDIVKLWGEDAHSWSIYDKKAARKFDSLFMKKLKAFINDDDVVYWIPSGTLHKISVESLLMQSHQKASFKIRRLSSARTLTDRAETQLNMSAVLYGGLQYDMNEDELKASQTEEDIPIHMYATRSRGHKDGFEPLPQSYEEVHAVKEIVDMDVMEVAVLDGKKGTEASFVRMSGNSPQILHVSTHGFYYTPEEATSVNALSGYKNAMLLSGLVLSGGNSEWKGETLISDYLGGLLTADDISKLDLSGTELVVLSACGTGQGEVTSEGVYGLQRAFKMAGVKHIVMTLWQVNDFVSKEFMKEFYGHLIYRGLTPDYALLETKRSIRDKYHDPYYWAGYVLLD